MKAMPLNITRRPFDGQATSLKHTHGRTQICKAVFDGEADCRGRKMEQNSQDKGRGEGRYTSARWHRLLCNWAPKLFIHRPPCPPFSSPSSTATDQGYQTGGTALGSVCSGVRLIWGFFGDCHFVQLFSTLNS